MADEMDGSWGAEENDAAPKEKVPERAKAVPANKDEVQAGEPASQPENSEAEESPASGELASAEQSDSGVEVRNTKADVEGEPVAASGESVGESGSPAPDMSARIEQPEPPIGGVSAEAPSQPSASTAQPEPQRLAAPPAETNHADPTARRPSADELDRPGLDLLYDVELDATLQFGSKEMLLRDVLELGPGDVVELDRHIAQPVDLVVGDRIVARGEVVVASGNFALRVTEVATPQMRLESIRCLF